MKVRSRNYNTFSHNYGQFSSLTGETLRASSVAEIGLTGTKLGCGEGGCGACTVMLSHYDASTGRVVHRSANACLCPLYAVEGMQVITVEGKNVTSAERRCNPDQNKPRNGHTWDTHVLTGGNLCLQANHLRPPLAFHSCSV